MIDKEVAEIRKRYKIDKNNISKIRGCYVNEKGEILSQFTQYLPLMPEDEAEKFLSLLRRTLSGTLNKNLVDIEFSTQQVMDSDEHKLLTELKNSKLDNEEAVQNLYQKTIQSLALESNYVILLAHDVYDIPYQSRNDEGMDDGSSEVFSYILCCICPVKLTPPALSYYASESEFHSRKSDWIISPPELGFMFPSFDDRSSNIYNSLFYTRNIKESYQEYIEAIFNNEAPMPAAVQKETFQELLSGTLAEECNFDVVQSVHSQLQEMIEEHKVNKEEEPLTITKSTVTQILKSNGVSDPSVAAFEEEFDAEFGSDTELSPRNIVDTKKTQVNTPNVTIQINTTHQSQVESRVIDGTKYILVRAEEGVEVNGVPVRII